MLSIEWRSTASVQLSNAVCTALQVRRKKNELPPKPFQIFLSGVAGVGKSFLIKTVTEYLKRVLRYPNQNLDQPSIFVTASTGKAGTGINGITLHSAFHLSVKSGLKSFEYKKPSDETLRMLRSKYQHLKVLIIDEISVIRRETFGHLDLAFKAIMQNSSSFCRVSLLLEIFCNCHLLTKKVSSWNQVRDRIGYSMDVCWKNSNCMSWLRLFGRAVTQILLNYLIGFKKVSKQIMMWFK